MRASIGTSSWRNPWTAGVSPERCQVVQTAHIPVRLVARRPVPRIFRLADADRRILGENRTPGATARGGRSGGESTKRRGTCRSLTTSTTNGSNSHRQSGHILQIAQMSAIDLFDVRCIPFFGLLRELLQFSSARRAWLVSNGGNGNDIVVDRVSIRPRQGGTRSACGSAELHCARTDSRLAPGATIKEAGGPRQLPR